MSRLLHRLRTAATIALNIAVTFFLIVGHPSRVIANRKKRRMPLSHLLDGPVRNVLIVKMDGLGDFVLATPLLRALRSRLPEAHLTVVVDRWLRDSIEATALADEVIGFDWRGGIVRSARRAAKLARAQLSAHYELSIVPRWEIDLNFASLLSFLSGASFRVGFSRKVSRRKRFLNLFNDSLYSHLVFAGAELHEVDKNLALARSLGLEVREPELYFRGSPLPAKVEESLRARTDGRAEAPLVAFGIGAMAENRRWPVEYYSKVASWILASHPACRVVLIGGPSDSERASTISRGTNGDPRMLDLTGKLTLNQSFELLRRCTLFVGNDSGPKHLAVAAKTRVVEISSFPEDGDPVHYTAANRYGAWGSKATILQPEHAVAPCHGACERYEAHCIATIEPDRVIAAIEPILAEDTVT